MEVEGWIWDHFDSFFDGEGVKNEQGGCGPSSLGRCWSGGAFPSQAWESQGFSDKLSNSHGRRFLECIDMYMQLLVVVLPP